MLDATVFVGFNGHVIEVALCACAVHLGTTRDLGDHLEIDLYADPVVQIHSVSLN